MTMQHVQESTAASAAMTAIDLNPNKNQSYAGDTPSCLSPSSLHGANSDTTNTSNGTDDDDATVHMRLEGKVAIVAGGARGIGNAIARTFVLHGARVVIADTDDDAAGELLAAALGTPQQQASYVHCDVSREADVERAVAHAVARHGQLDVLLCCASDDEAKKDIHKGGGGIASLDAAEFGRVLRVNALGAALGMKHAARAMLPRRAGSVVVVAAGVAGVLGGLGHHACAAAEHAVVGLVKNAACELGAHGIRVNCISPAPMLLVDDDDDDVRHTLLRQSDVAEAALFLASDESRYVSGHNLVVDAGLTTSRNLIGL